MKSKLYACSTVMSQDLHVILHYHTCLKWFTMQQKSASLESWPKPLLDEPQRCREQPKIMRKIITALYAYNSDLTSLEIQKQSPFKRSPMNKNNCRLFSYQRTVCDVPISLWTCQQERSLYISKTFKKPTSKAHLTKAGFTDQRFQELSILLFKVTKITPHV